MKLSVLALDYDGTLTRDERLAPSMTEAIADARRRGVAVMLVTGRRLTTCVASPVISISSMASSPRTAHLCTFPAVG